MPKKDDLVDTPAIAWWFEGLRIGLGQKRPYGVEKIVEPDAFGEVKSGYGHTNKWRFYKSGQRRPRASLIAKAEKILPSSSASFAHPIWKVGRLMADESIACVASEWLHQLNVAILPWFFRVNPSSGMEFRRGVSARMLRSLSHRADLDALAALAILLREAAENRRYKVAMAAGEALYQALLHAAVRGSEQMRIVLPKIAVMLVERVFPFSRDRHSYYCFDGLDCSAFYDLFVFSVRVRKGALGLSVNDFGIRDVDSVIFGGFVRPFGFLQFSLPKRPLISTEQYSEAEENFHAHIAMWQAATNTLRNMRSVDATLSEGD